MTQAPSFLFTALMHPLQRRGFFRKEQLLGLQVLKNEEKARLRQELHVRRPRAEIGTNGISYNIRVLYESSTVRSFGVAWLFAVTISTQWHCQDTKDKAYRWKNVLCESCRNLIPLSPNNSIVCLLSFIRHRLSPVSPGF